MAEVCIVCGNKIPPGLPVPARACTKCQQALGVMIPMPPRRRRATPCVRCNHPVLVRVIPRELTVVGGVDTNFPEIGPIYATYKVTRRIESSFFGATTAVDRPSLRDGLGVFEAYICRRCGFVDWYCLDPETIPIGPEYMTEELDCEGTEPYR